MGFCFYLEGAVRGGSETWGAKNDILVLDGEKALRGAQGVRATDEAGYTVEQLPPNSPDLNPIENAWALCNGRMRDTDPAKLETHPEFKARANNAVRWANANKKAELLNMVASMRKRLAAAVKRKGARTGY